MERPPKKYVCEKCGYLGDTSEHEGCDYLAWTTGEQLYIDQLERDLALLKASPASAPEGFTMSEPTILPDGSGFGTMSFPLPKDHWIYKEREYEDGAIEPNDLPAPILTHSFRRQVIAAIRYAVRSATNCGKEDDFDPDALVQNAVYALCGPYGKAAPTPPENKAPLEAVAEVVWYDPQLSHFPEKPGKIIDGSIAFMESAKIGTKLFPAPTPSSPASAPEGWKDFLQDLTQKISEAMDHTPDSFHREMVRLAHRAHKLLASAPTPPSTEDRWLPIETAPKDGFVLLAGPSGYTTIETVFATGRMCSDYHVGRWIDHANDDLTDWGFEPTHWMPLPKAPAMQEDKS